MEKKRKACEHCETDVEYIQPLSSKQKNIRVNEDKERKMVVVKIYGEIEEPEEYIDELFKLELLSNVYEVLEITLNSGGGSVNTAVDIVSLINRYNYVITIGKGEVASAAFMIWTMGNIRVVTDYSMYMAHRESYGLFGKTSEHRDAALTFGKVYEEMFENCFGDLLTDKEKQIADRSEAWISYTDLLKRNRVISFHEYVEPSNPYTVVDLYVTNTAKMFIFDNETETFKSIEMTYGNETIVDMTEYLYNLAEIIEDPVLDELELEVEEEKPKKKKATPKKKKEPTDKKKTAPKKQTKKKKEK